MILLTEYSIQAERPLALGVPAVESQIFPSPVELAKLQLHRHPGSVPPKPELLFRDGRGSVPESLVESARYFRNWFFADQTISALIT
jgi:hypothetical protein